MDPLFAAFCATARAAGKRVILDTYGAPARPALESAPHWVRANREELETTYGRSFDDDLEKFLADLAPSGVEGLVVTDGPGRIRCVSSAGSYEVRPPPVDEVNPVGSGDALTGAFVLALEQGHDVETALRWGGGRGVGQCRGASGLRGGPRALAGHAGAG